MPERFENPEESKRYLSFEEQFKQKEVFDFFDGKIEAVDLRPEHQKNDVPTVVSPGWGETQKSSTGTLKTLFDLNRRVISFDHPRTGADEIEESGEHSVDEVRKAVALLKLIEEKGIEKVDMITRSEGAINAVIAASMAPEKFRNLVLFAPGGMIGKDTFPKLIGRFGVSGIKSVMRKITGKGPVKIEEGMGEATDEVFKYVKANPVRAFREARAISSAEIHEMLKELHGQGIGISVVAHVDDAVFPMNRIQEIAKADQLDGFYSVKGEHGSQHENSLFAKLADEALDDLEKKYQRNGESE